MTFKELKDIEREKREEARKEFKEEVSEDINEMLGKIFPKKKKKKRWILLKWLGILFLFLFMITLVLGTAWILKALVKSLFFGG